MTRNLTIAVYKADRISIRLFGHTATEVVSCCVVVACIFAMLAIGGAF